MLSFLKNNEETRLRAFALKSGAFNSKKTAFDYYYIFEGKSVEEAERLSGIVSKARGVPDTIPIPESTIDKIKGIIKQGSDLANENPKIADFVIGLLSGAATSFTGVAVGSQLNDSNKEEKKYEINDIEPLEINNNETDTV